MDIITVALAIVALVVIAIAGWLLKMAVENLMRTKAQKAPVSARDPLVASLQPGRPSIIYFTGETQACIQQQTPILCQLKQERGDAVQFVEVHIDQDLDAAHRWGVMKVPRTFILDRNLHIYASNLDVATLATLKQQLDEAEQQADNPQPMKLVGIGRPREQGGG